MTCDSCWMSDLTRRGSRGPAEKRRPTSPLSRASLTGRSYMNCSTVHTCARSSIVERHLVSSNPRSRYRRIWMEKTPNRLRSVLRRGAADTHTHTHTHRTHPPHTSLLDCGLITQRTTEARHCHNNVLQPSLPLPPHDMPAAHKDYCSIDQRGPRYVLGVLSVLHTLRRLIIL